MRKFTLVLMMITTIATVSFAGRVEPRANGRWDKASNWNPHVPSNNDTILIPSNRTITLDGTEDYRNVVIIIEGELAFDNAKLNLDENSKVIVQPNGKITAKGANDQIRLDKEMKYKGNEGVLYGPALADQTTGKGFVVFSVMPVQFISFDVHKAGNAVLLNWVTDQEKNNSHFKVERSRDGKIFETIGMVFAKEEGMVNRYEFRDPSAPEATVYYRLRQIDQDGRSSFSRVQFIRSAEPKESFLAYSPAQNNICVKFSNPLDTQIEVKVLNMRGQVVSTRIAVASTTSVDIRSNSLVKGMYVVQLVSRQGLKDVKKVLL